MKRAMHPMRTHAGENSVFVQKPEANAPEKFNNSNIEEDDIYQSSQGIICEGNIAAHEGG